MYGYSVALIQRKTYTGVSKRLKALNGKVRNQGAIFLLAGRKISYNLHL